MSSPPPTDPLDVPRYGIAEAARFVHVRPATLRSWVLGRTGRTRDEKYHWPPLILIPRGSDRRLSFSNLIEAHVLSSLRTDRAIAVKAVREALAVSAIRSHIGRLLVSPALGTDVGLHFLDIYSQLIELRPSDRIAIRAAFDRHIARIAWAPDGAPAALFPFYGLPTGPQRSISLVPGVAGGRPVIHRRGIQTTVIVDRLDAGETPEFIAADYGLERNEVVDAATYERAA